jgi:hypothetical protein
MTATKEQIVAEAERRWENELGEREWSAVDYIIDVIREGWTPPEPIDPDVELARTIARNKHSKLADVRAVEATATAVLAGIKAGRDQERERAGPVVEFLENSGLSLSPTAREVLAKYNGEA